MDNPPLILDGCCLLTLFATLRLEEFLTDLPREWYVGERAQRDAIYIQPVIPGPPFQVRLQPSIDSGLLKVAVLESPLERALYVEIGSRVQAGEAEAAAIAITRRWAFATDDRKVLRLLSSRPDRPPILGTMELLEEWYRCASLPDQEMGEVLQRVRRGARFTVPRDHPLTDWWDWLIGR